MSRMQVTDLNYNESESESIVIDTIEHMHHRAIVVQDRLDRIRSSFGLGL